MSDEFERWYRDLAPLLTRYAVRKFRVPADEAEALVHEVFLAYLNRRTPIESVRSWFVGAVSHACRDWWRKHGRVVTGDAVPERTTEPRDLVRITAREVLRALPPAEARVLWLQAGEGWRVKEIALRVGLSVSRTEKLLRRARKHAAAVLGADEGDDVTNRLPAGRGARFADTYRGYREARRIIRGHVRPLRGAALPRTHSRVAVLSADGRPPRQVRRQFPRADGRLQTSRGAA